MKVKETVSIFSYMFQYELIHTKEARDTIQVLEKHLQVLEMRDFEFKEKSAVAEEAHRKITAYFLNYLKKLPSISVVPAIINELVKQEQKPKYA